MNYCYWLSALAIGFGFMLVALVAVDTLLNRYPSGVFKLCTGVDLIPAYHDLLRIPALQLARYLLLRLKFYTSQCANCGMSARGGRGRLPPRWHCGWLTHKDQLVFEVRCEACSLCTCRLRQEEKYL